MFRSSTLIFLAFIFLFSTPPALSQTSKGELKPGTEYSSEIGPEENHKYSIRLDKDRFAFFRLMQTGVDLMITTYGPDGEKIESFDSPNGKNGYETFSLRSDEPGTYTFEVTPVNEDQPAGAYDLKVEDIRAKAVTKGEKVDEIFAAWDTNETPGVAVAVIQDGEIVYKNGYGLANLEYDIPITPSTIFHIASISKQFTVFATLLLENQGKLSLDDDIRKYVPEVPDFGKTITLRHLASHTSGLRDQWNLLALAGWRLDDVITKEHVLKLVSKQQDLNFDPGQAYAYSNTGFTLLAEVVARVSGKSFPQFTQENIFEPLGMTNTLFYDDHQKIVRNRAYSYASDSTGYKKRVLSYANVGATSLFTTVEDLSLWAMNFSDPRVGNDIIFEKMTTPAVLNNGEEFGGALGQFVGDYKKLKMVQHGGADAGYRAYFTRFPDEDFAVIVMSNEASFTSGSMANKVVDVYLKDRIQTEAEEVKEETAATEEIVDLDEQTRKSYFGEYELQPGVTITVTEDDGALYAQATGQQKLKLIPVSTEEFIVENVGARIRFEPVQTGNVQKIVVEMDGPPMEAARVKPFDKSAVNKAAYTGTFYSEELTTEYNLVLEDGKLVARHMRHSDIELSPVKEDVFNADTWFFGLVEFIRNDKDNISGFTVSTGRVKDLFFEKKE